MRSLSEQSPYHHGALRDAAVLAAVERLRCGDEGLCTVRDLAAELGVTHGALYRHFPNKDALTATVAGQGFSLMIASMPTGKKATSRAVMQAYVDFALAQPSLYRLMFSLVSKSLMQEPSPGPQVRQMIAITTEAFRKGHDDHDVRDRVISAWGMAHGLLDLWRSGSLPAKTPQRASEYIIDQMVSFGVVS